MAAVSAAVGDVAMGRTWPDRVLSVSVVLSCVWLGWAIVSSKI